jgi:hypothetical protein
MILKLLGILDIFIGICFWIFGIFQLKSLSGFIFALGIILLIKGVIFMTQLSIASILDIVFSFIIIGASSVAMPKVVVIITTLFLLQKGIFSLLS